jgi:lipopolysaccharide export system permease protein
MIRLKRLHVLFYRNFIGPFLATFVISLFLFLMQFLWKYVEDLVGKGLELLVIFEFIFYSSIHLIPLALPLSILLSSIMMFGNLGERYELAAIKSSGVSLIKAMRPMIVLIFLISIFAFYLSNVIIPKANLSWGALLYDVMHKKPALNIKDGVFYNDLDGYAIKVGKKYEDNQTIEDVLIYASSGKIQNSDIIIAKRGKMMFTEDERFLLFTLEDGKRYQEMTNDRNYKKTMPHNVMEFERYEMAINLSDLQFKRTKKDLFKDDYRMMNVLQLENKIDSFSNEINRKEGYLTTYITPYFHVNNDTVAGSSYQFSEDQLNTPIHKQLKPEDVIPNDSSSIQREEMTEPVNPIAGTGNIAKLSNRRNRTRSKKRAEVTFMEMKRNAKQTLNNMKNIIENNRSFLEKQIESRAKYASEWHRKFTLSVSCLLLFFIGAPLGAIIRKGGFGLPFVFSLLLFIVYYIINVIGEKLVKESTLTPFTGMWLSTFVLFPFALWLTYQASTDSRLFDADAYKRLIRAINRLFKREVN